jgi:hypothetical protein
MDAETMKPVNPHYDESFYRKRPLLYADVFSPASSTPIGARGIECGPGWKLLLEFMSDELEAFISSMVEVTRRPRAAQIKQKFGGLRVYMDGPTNSFVLHVISRAEDTASVTCETCGAPGEQLGFFVLCKKCVAES